MEEQARRCCVLFVPFRNANTDLKSNGCYLERWRKEKQNGKLSAHHEQLLMNVQNCRNSMNGGRPLDMIERLTMKPSKMLHREKIDVEEEEEDDLINEAMDHFLVTGSLEGGYDNDFRDGRGRFQFQSILTRCYKSHKCGTNLVICPNVGPGDRILVIEANETMITEQHEITSIRNERDDRLNVRALNELAIKCVRRIFDKKGHIVDIEVNGTLKNVCDFADINFCKDVDQKTSFQIIICAFIDQLYKEAEKNTKESVEDEWVNDHPRKSTKRRRCDTLRHQIGKVVNNKQLIGFLSGAGGTGKSHVIKTVCRYAQKLCEELRVKFNKRSIVVTALTGAAAVSINGKTTAKAFAFKREVRNELKEFKNAYLVIVDEVSFAHKGPLEKNIPPDAVYATKTNVDRMAINDAIFVKHLEKTHSTDANVQPLMHTLCIKAGTLRFHVRGTRKEYHAMEKKAQDIIYASVGEAHVQDKTKKYHDPLLKLYHGRPLCIKQNEDVSGCVANGAMCEFRGVKLKPGVSITDFETILIDGYCVHCVCVTQIESMVVKMLDWTTGGDEAHLIELKPKTISASARFPVPCVGPITKKSMRVSRTISFEQFPVNCANARTVHKLQGQSIKNLVKTLMLMSQLVAGNAMFFLSVP
ncbi:AAA domain containing protein [Nitzschia inconspicua]|uniref:AAA domain containing protein n=1 Tax=Nitzschia inconspicua TaxID=303405 RepID=A0A9K3PM18_9STRA|nr:AAA domain containing protein [Nitzschia inconspicua]